MIGLCKMTGVLCGVMAAVAGFVALHAWSTPIPNHLTPLAGAVARLELVACAVAMGLIAAACFNAAER